MPARKPSNEVCDRRTRINSLHLTIIRDALKEYKKREHESMCDDDRIAINGAIKIYRDVKRTPDKRGW